jgi:hypothetical protein
MAFFSFIGERDFYVDMAVNLLGFEGTSTSPFQVGVSEETGGRRYGTGGGCDSDPTCGGDKEFGTRVTRVAVMEAVLS